MRLLFLGIILCLEITSPNGTTVGKKPVVLSCIVILEKAWPLSKTPPLAKASVHRPELEPAPHIGCLSFAESFNQEKVPHGDASRWFCWRKICLRFFLATLPSEQTERACACEDGRQWGYSMLGYWAGKEKRHSLQKHFNKTSPPTVKKWHTLRIPSRNTMPPEKNYWGYSW